MKTSNPQNEIVVRCGKTTDSMEKLTNLCEQEAEKLVKTLDIAEGDAISVIFLQYQVPDSLNLSVWEYSVGTRVERSCTNWISRSQHCNSFPPFARRAVFVSNIILNKFAKCAN